MTGTPIALRRWSTCNLHARSPLLPRDRNRQYFDPPPRYNRMKLYISPEHASQSPKYGRDSTGVYSWTLTDCIWEWLANLPPFRNTPICSLLTRVHVHVHAPHRPPTVNLALITQRALVRLTRSRSLDERLETRVYLDSHLYRISATFSDLTERDKDSIRFSFPKEYVLFKTTLGRNYRTPLSPGPLSPYLTTTRTRVTWYEKASNPSHALQRARDRLQKAGVSASASWENPVRDSLVYTP